ncbi:MAG TPA: DUF1592 domain-containing protein, partial [Tepidisphaeraceae bacterium]|nr:DUF1592 domain-containing protein [Tepidisphaeraceae bacterium]
MLASGVARAAGPAIPPGQTAFFKAHCYACHDADVQKGGLDLTALSADLSTPDAVRRWTTIYDRLESGEMPPKDKPRPAPADAKAALDWAGNELRAAGGRRQQSVGRAFVRRLSRVEYENTVRDLLGIDVDLKELLPEDSSAHGFDNQDASLAVSPVLVERYLEAADAALDAAIVHGPKPPSTTNRYSYLKEGGQVAVAVKSNKYVIPLADAMVFMTANHPPKILGQFRAPVAGRYRFKVSCYTYDNKVNRPLSMLVYAGSQSPKEGKNWLSGAFDVPTEPGVIEFEERLDKKDTIRLVAHNLVKQYNKGAADFKGPGLAVQWVEVEGPIVDQWPPAGHTRLLGNADLERGTPADAERIVREFLPRAFRRPTAPADAEPYVALIAARLKAGAPFEQALKVGLKAVMCSPHFLYLKTAPGELDDHALATRLSYFLWNSMPDDALTAAATAGKLRDPAELRRQVDRMIAGPKAARFTRHFTDQWLNLKDIDATTPDPKLYPEFDDLLQTSMLGETRAFFDEVLKNDLGVDAFVRSDFAILNARLAEHYDVPGVTGQKLRKVQLPPGSVRGGVMTQAAILKVTANGTNTSPVPRGVFVLDRILGRPAPPPPQNVPAVEPDIRGATTIREQLSRHREPAACGACHVKIDPPGYALESFDVIGGYRENYRALAVGFKGRVKGKDGHPTAYTVGPKVTPADTLADGRAFADVNQFKDLLLADKDAIARAMAEKLLVYGTGHGLEFADRSAVKQIVENVKPKAYGFKSLIHEV